tara:strand:+ start:324 stop:542 length:219 start_codon:yes stop_codon:yes gene_type:complete
LKFFIDENWVYFYKNSTLYKSSIDCYGFFHTDHGIPVNFYTETEEVSHLERLKTLLMPKSELAQGAEQLTLF